MLFIPFPIGKFRSNLLLDFFIVDDALLLRIDEEHFPRLKTAFIKNIFRRNGECPYFRTGDDPVVAGDIIAGRTQAVAVEHAADDDAVTESDSGRAVPRFNHEVMIAVEIPFFLAHERVFFPRFGNHHHHGMGKGVSCHIQVFQAVVEHGRVAATVIDDGKDLFQVREITGFGFAFPGIEPVYIPLDGVDFSVVDDITVRMGPGPAGECIGAETGVDERHGGRKIQVGQIQVKMAQLDRGQHALIDNGPRRQTGDVEIGALFLTGRDDLLFRHLADDI